MLEKFRKNNKKGFTLVELIVVLVILAILAALLIPALTGYIDKAKEKQIIAETRQIVMAAQTVLDEKYAKEAVGGSVNIVEEDLAKIEDLSELSGLTWSTATPSVANGVYIKVADQKITQVMYKAHGLLCTYNLENTSDTANDAGYNVMKSN